MIDEFRLARYRLTLQARDRLLLPPYKGSTFRGGFGNAFKRISCSNRGPGQGAGGNSRGGVFESDCLMCMLKEQCPYGYIFETSPPADAEALRNYEHVPHPFVLEPTEETKTEYEPGERLSVGLVLVGRAIDYLPYFIVAFRELGEIGLGKGRGKFELVEVVTEGISVSSPVTGFQEDEAVRGKIIYSGSNGKVYNRTTIITGEELFKAAKGIRGTIGIRFKTMTRLKHRGNFAGRPEFHVVIRSLVGRVSSLLYFHHGVRLEMDFKGFFARAEEVRLIEDLTTWVDWERYSSRQDTRMKLGGIVGKAKYSGEGGEFMPWLLLGEQVHVGKGATFGLGKYTVEVG